MEKNINLINFANELGSIVDQPIGLEHIHAMSKGRGWYIQKPEVGAPMLLNHYRGPFFVDIHPDDFEKITSGEVSAHNYIYSANWQIGYFWGGGTMVNGGYYQPFDIVNHVEEVRMYFKTLACRGHYRASGYMPSEENCKTCQVEKCSLSKYKEDACDSKIQEYDPRIDFFEALRRRFESQFPGYTLDDLYCADNSENDTIILIPNVLYADEDSYTFRVYASDNVIKGFLMHKIIPEDWDGYAKNFKFKLHQMCSQEYFEATEENVRAIFNNVDYVVTRKQDEAEPESDFGEVISKKEDCGIVARFCRFFKNIF